jgi:hypothetical protein
MGSAHMVQSTQLFFDNDESYNARLVATPGNHDRWTQTFNSQVPAYKARFRAALGQQPHVDPDPDPDPNFGRLKHQRCCTRPN